MKYTKKLGLKKPEISDKFDIADFNENADIIDKNFAKDGSQTVPKTTTIYTAKPTTESYVTTVTKEEL